MIWDDIRQATSAMLALAARGEKIPAWLRAYIQLLRAGRFVMWSFDELARRHGLKV